MKHSFILIFFVSFLNVRNCPGQTNFPDTISINNIETSVRLKGTRLFLTIPADYKVRHRATGYEEFQKDSTTGFQIVENINDNFYRLKNEFLKNPGGLKNEDTGTSKAVKVGSFDGVYYTGPFKTAEQKSVFLVFGDSSFEVTIVGVFQRTDKVAETELNDILKTTGYDKSMILNPLELLNFKIDITITGFKYVPLIGMKSLTYSTDGVLNSIVDERHKSTFELETFSYTDIESAKKIIKFKMEELTEFMLSKLSNVHHRNIKINDNAAYEVTMDEQGSYIANTKFYIVVIQKGNIAVLFWGVDRDNGKWLEKFKSTVQSIKL